MSKITNVDKNFEIVNGLSRGDVKLYDITKEPFSVFGLQIPDENDDKFKRMPYDVAKKVNDGVAGLYHNTAGGRVKFKTDSDYIALIIEAVDVACFSHMPLSGVAGFDLYKKDGDMQKYVGSFIPPYQLGGKYSLQMDLKGGGMTEYTINFPLYSGVKSLYMALSENAKVEKCDEYKIKKTIVYYGSSITQGGCASRPGNSYQAIISRRLDCDYINLGFSGSARGEDAMTDYINNLDMSLLVLDYDHNAPTPEHLEKTHERMFKSIRQKHPELPIICVTMPICCYKDDPEADRRREIIRKTVDNAIKSGDKFVGFVDGSTFMDEIGTSDSLSVDNCHPNDLGFMSMANVIEKSIKEFL